VVIPVCIHGTRGYDATLPTSYIIAQQAQWNNTITRFLNLRHTLLLNHLEPPGRSTPFREVSDAKVCAHNKLHDVA
jgi:predicted PolB exonuclease-like 3'-5' exonuclease